MKKLLFVFTAVLALAVCLQAQDTTSTQRQSDRYRSGDQSTSKDKSSGSTQDQSTSGQGQSTTGQDQSTSGQSTTGQDQSASGSQRQNMRSDDYTDKDVISASELPSSIRQQLQGQDYSGWTVDKTYRKMKNNQTMYAVELKNGDQTKKVKFDASGNIVKEKTKGNN